MTCNLIIKPDSFYILMMFPIVEVIPQEKSIESLGTKEKFWYKNELGEEWLFKQIRYAKVNDVSFPTGEDWSEKISACLANMLGIPFAIYELAIFEGKRGVVSKKIQNHGEILSLGNQLLAQVNKNYPSNTGTRFFKTPFYTIEVVLRALEEVSIHPTVEALFPTFTSGHDLFAGYLLLDAWIGNSDRHDNNWGVLQKIGNPTLYLAPTFDHASSLGRELSEKEKTKRLTTKDQGFNVEKYVSKNRSAFFSETLESAKSKTISPLAVFEYMLHKNQRIGHFWLERIATIETEQVNALFEQIPSDRISRNGKDFAQKILHLNQQNLLYLL